MRDEEIKRLLENVEVKPSAHCWEAIEGNLAAAAGAAGAAGTAATATKVAGHTLSTAAKIIIGAVGAAAIATTAIILSLPKTDSVVPTQQNTDNQIVITDSTHTDELLAEVTEVTTDPQPAQPAVITSTPETSQPSEATADESSVAATDGATASTEPAPKVAETTTVPAPASPKAAPSSTPTKSPVAPAQPKPTTKPAVTTKQQPSSSLTDLSDPVLDDAETFNSIDFTPPVALIIPNVITPNGDGYNDVFIIKGIEQTERNRLIIRNSSGTIVFQTVNYRNDWGAPNIANGTYFYQFVYTLHGIDETRTGTLTIMR